MFHLSYHSLLANSLIQQQFIDLTPSGATDCLDGDHIQNTNITLRAFKAVQLS